MPLERVGRPSASSGPLSSRKLYAMSWLCVYSFSPCDAARSPKKFHRSAASSQSATNALFVGSLPVPMWPKPRMFATSHWASNAAMVASLIVDGIDPWLPSASSPRSSSHVRSSWHPRRC
jgi:hypothetical protein